MQPPSPHHRRVFSDEGGTSPKKFRLDEDFALRDELRAMTHSDQAMEFSHVSVVRDGREILHDLTFTVAAGECVAVVGPNGGGKSTLIKTLTRECYPVIGEGSYVRMFGRDRWDVFALRALLGIVTADAVLGIPENTTARETVLAGFFGSKGLSSRNQPSPEMFARAEQILEELDLVAVADRPMSRLSSGQQRRAIIGQALIHDPTTLVLDEPTTFLDLRAQHELRSVMRRLAQRGVGIVLVTHHIEELFDEITRCLLLGEGRILGDGAPAAVLTSENLSRLFRLPVEVDHDDAGYHARVGAGAAHVISV